MLFICSNLIPNLNHAFFSSFKHLWCIMGLNLIKSLIHPQNKMKAFLLLLNLSDALWKWLFWRVTYAILHSIFGFIVFFKPLWCILGLSSLFNNKFRIRLLCMFKNALWEFIFWRVTYTVSHSSYIFIVSLKSLRCMMGLNLFNSHLCNLRMKPNLFLLFLKLWCVIGMNTLKHYLHNLKMKLKHFCIFLHFSKISLSWIFGTKIPNPKWKQQIFILLHLFQVHEIQTFPKVFVCIFL